MSAQVPAPSAGPPIGLIVGGVVLIVVIIVIVLWQTGVFSTPAPSLGPAPGPTQYTTGSQNITALISEMNGVFGSRVSNCPNVIQQMATWADSMGIIAVPQGASCPSSAPTAWPLGGNSNSGGIILCYPQNAPPATTQPPTAIATLLTQCMQAGAPPPQVVPVGTPLK